MGGEHGANDRQDDLLSRGEIDMGGPCGTLCADEIKEKVTGTKVGNPPCITQDVQLPCLVALQPLFGVDADVVGRGDVR